MKATTIQKRIDENLKTKTGQIQKRFLYLLTSLKNGCNKFYGKYWKRSKGYLTLYDTDYNNMVLMLTLLGIDYMKGNDAPSGGVQGDYIEITAKGKRQLREWRNN